MPEQTQSIVSRLAHYNSVVNRKLYDLLQSLPSTTLHKATGSYYSSAFGLLNHILRSDLGWLNRLRETFPDNRTLQSSVVELPPGPASTKEMPGTHIHGDLSSLRTQRFELDALFEKFVDSLSPEDLAREHTLRNSRGEETTRRVEDILLQLFIHQAHHRGAVTQILDSEGIEHDFSSYLATRI